MEEDLKAMFFPDSFISFNVLLLHKVREYIFYTYFLLRILVIKALGSTC